MTKTNLTSNKKQLTLLIMVVDVPQIKSKWVGESEKNINLQQNLDMAFERRFLYKIKFEKPSAEARAHIWHEMIPELDGTDVQTLATKYDFSGGQIENIARHYNIDCILHGTKADTLNMLITHCDNERLDSKENRRIGF